jgi:hypothetical protein
VSAAPVDAHGGDAALAAAAGRAGASVRFVPDETSDLARALGVTAGHRVSTATDVDLLQLGSDITAANMIVLGPPPDRLRWYHRGHECVVEVDGRGAWRGRATTVVIANGEYLRGKDVVPRGHPADGRFEVHVYALAPGQRSGMRRRLAAGTHVPHPGIRTLQGAHIAVRWDRPVRLEVDGRGQDREEAVEVTIRPGAVRLEP